VASSKYDTTVDLADRNNSHTLMVELIGANKRVLDVGCANGYLAKVLVEHGCTVSGVEYDEKAAEQARPLLDQLVVGDLEQLDLVAELGTGRFDVVVFGDVLEHLRDPLPVLRSSRALLAPGGYAVLSIPNVAHGSVRLSLLKGRFDYRPLGLLDSTHIRFFTRDNLKALLRDAGFAATDFLRTTAGIYETELGVRPGDAPEDVVQQVLSDPDALTYQFVVRAVPDNADFAVTAMREQFEQRLEEALARVADAERRAAEAEEGREHDRSQLQTELTAMHHHVVARDQVIAARDEAIASLRAELEAVHATKVMRATRGVRAAYGRARGPRGH
jgi:2-polyprenyl-3-methyl-5-hydroxy-6-metoxy-1,4-benzoquinol methylase